MPVDKEEGLGTLTVSNYRGKPMHSIRKYRKYFSGGEVEDGFEVLSGNGKAIARCNTEHSANKVASALNGADMLSLIDLDTEGPQR